MARREGRLMEPFCTVILLGTYPPRECGIATFTCDLAKGIEGASDRVKCLIIAMDDGKGYNYPEEVVMVIPEDSPLAYVRAAKWVNNMEADIVCIQHEYGIFGGRDGKLLLDFLEELDKPVVTTLHTILPDPSPNQRRILKALVEQSDATVVMLGEGRKMLREIYKVSVAWTYVIHHGVPEFPNEDKEEAKRRLGLEGKLVISTFGLISEGKGFEYMIQAMPQVIRFFPNAVYLIVGETHPKVKAAYGERYRKELERMVRKLELEEHVKFENRYLPLEDLILYLTATDVYVTPYLNPRQATSGTLAYAIGAGKACVSTPYLYAREMLSNGRGLLVDFRSPKGLASRVIEVLSKPELRMRLERRALEIGCRMTWPEVGRQYLELFEEVLAERVRALHPHELPLTEGSSLEAEVNPSNLKEKGVGKHGAEAGKSTCPPAHKVRPPYDHNR